VFEPVPESFQEQVDGLARACGVDAYDDRGPVEIDDGAGGDRSFDGGVVVAEDAHPRPCRRPAAPREQITELGAGVVGEIGRDAAAELHDRFAVRLCSL
jgi:hypothetical protein